MFIYLLDLNNNLMFRHLLVLSSVVRVFSIQPTSTITTTAAAAMSLHSLDFEVYGRVQGVFFRKFTKEQALKLGLRGWCMNTSKGTVLGHVQGASDKVNSMMQWLKNTGSPSSKIDKAEFKNQKEINEYSFDSFDIRRD